MSHLQEEVKLDIQEIPSGTASVETGAEEDNADIELPHADASNSPKEKPGWGSQSDDNTFPDIVHGTLKLTGEDDAADDDEPDDAEDNDEPDDAEDNDEPDDAEDYDELDDAEDDPKAELAKLLIRPNNIPCLGFHKEIIRRKDNLNRIQIFIHPPPEHAKRESKEGFASNDSIKNAKELSIYLAVIKKADISLPLGCKKSSFGKFYTKASSLKGEDKKLLAAFDQQNLETSEKDIPAEYTTEEEEPDDDDDDHLFKKLEQDIQHKFLVDFHPEIMQIDFDELLALSRVVRNSTGTIIDDLHKTMPFMTKYEYTRILGIRAKQLNSGATPFTLISEDMLNGYTIAKKELHEKKIPFIIRRPIPSGASEYWRLEDLEIIH